MHFEGGYLVLGSRGRAPLRVHFTFPLLGIYFGGWSPWAWLAFFVVILVHELGHAVLVRAFGHWVTSIDITGFGGTCTWVGAPTALESALVAWGGVFAQGALYAVAQAALDLGAGATSPIAGTMLLTFVSSNVWVLAFNLLPIAPLDGDRAWAAFPMLWRAARAEAHRASPSSAPARAPRPPSVEAPPEAPDPSAARAREASAERERLFDKILSDLSRAKPPPGDDEDPR